MKLAVMLCLAYFIPMIAYGEVGEYDFKADNLYYTFDDDATNDNMVCHVVGFNIADSNQVSNVKSYVTYLGESVKVLGVSGEPWVNIEKEGLVADSLIFHSGVDIQYQSLRNVPFRNLVLPEGMTEAYLDLNDAVEYLALPSTLKTIKRIRAWNLKAVNSFEHVTSIEDNAFYWSKFESVILPDSMTYLGSNAFRESPIKELRLPLNIHVIPTSCFANAKLKRLPTSPDSLTLGSGAIGLDNPNLYIPDNYVMLYSGTSGMKSITGGRNLKEIPSRFSASSKLESIALDGGRKIGHSAFWDNLENLKSVSFGEGVDTISSYAINQFRDNNYNGSVPNSLVKYYPHIYITYRIEDSEKPFVIESEGTGEGNLTITSMYVGRNINYVTSKYHKYGLLYYVKEVTFGPLVTSLPVGAFMDLESMDKLPQGLPKNLQSISDSCFMGMSGISEFKVPVPVKQIGERAFYNASGLQKIILPPTLDSIAPRAFSNVTDLSCVVCSALEPPSLSFLAFSEETYMNARLEVPNPEVYRQAPGWENFRNITTTGIDAPEADDDAPSIRVEGGMIKVDGSSNVEIYSTDGRLIFHGNPSAISTLAPGFYIVRAGASTVKIKL